MILPLLRSVAKWQRNRMAYSSWCFFFSVTLSFIGFFFSSTYPNISPSMSQHQETLVQDIKSLQTNFNEILTSGHHYFTNEIAGHVKHINNALDNIKLDVDFQRGSKNWTKQFDSGSMRLNQSSTVSMENRTLSHPLVRLDVKQLIEQGRHLTRELNTCLDTTNVKNKEENQIRELHSWACKTSSLFDLVGFHPRRPSSRWFIDWIPTSKKERSHLC